MLGNPLGFEPSGELFMGELRARLESGSIFLERFDFLRIRALTPRERWFPSLAWSFPFALDRAKEMRCESWRCLRGVLNGGGGLSFRQGPFIEYLLGETDFELGGVFDPNYRWSYGPTAGVRLEIGSGTRALVESEWRWRILGEKRQRRLVRAGISQDLARNWELRLEAETNRDYREGAFSAYWYF